MRPEEFLKEFGHLAETEEGVGQLRRLVPSLAATGGLSPTGTEFSERTGSELFQFVTSGSRGWAKYYADDGATFLRIGNLDYQTIELDLESIQCVRPPAGAEGTRTRVRSGDILVSITGDTGMVGVVREGLGEAYINQHVALARPVSGLLPDYLAWSLTSTAVLSTLQSYQRGIKNSLGLEDIRRLKFAVPPLPEQKRIVEKVDQLMALCDELEAKQKQKREKAVSLNKAALSAVVHAPDKSKLKSSWSRVQDHFEVLYELPENVKELRQTILQLAVMGKLVRQEEGDEVPSQNSSKKATATPFSVPETWCWTRLDNVCLDSFYGPRFAKGDYVSVGGVPTIRTTDMTRDGRIEIENTPRIRLEEKRLEQYRVKKGDLLVTRTGSIGTMAVFDGEYDAIPSAYLIRFRFSESVLVRFVYYYLLSRTGQELLGLGTTRVAQPNVNATSIRAFPFPCPPIREQGQIVLRIESLLRVCDELEATLARHRDQGQRLMQAVVESLVA